MIDVRKVRDEVLDALAGFPIAAAWLYQPLGSGEPSIAVAILPAEPISACILLELGKELRWAVRLEPCITRLNECSPSMVEYILKYGALISDRNPALRQQFVEPVAKRAEENERQTHEIERALKELRAIQPAAS